MRFSKLPNRADRGYTLVVGLLLLVVLTLFAIGMFRSFGLQEKIAANTRDKQRALEAAQSALQYGEWWLGQGNGSPMQQSPPQRAADSFRGTPRNRLRRAAGVAPGRGLAKRHAVREDWGRDEH